MITIADIPKSHYKVLIRCNTYNQSKYIEDALNGFVIQYTDFPFLVYVIDDASTDGEQGVLRRWIDNHCNQDDINFYDTDLAHVIMAKDMDNNNCIYAIHLLKKNLYGTQKKQEIHKLWREQCEYEALCEGDDYWIDTYKLQKQVNYLLSNSNKSLVFTDCNWFEQDNELYHYDIFKSGFRRLYLDFKTYLLDGAYIAPPTWMYRIKAIKEMNSFKPKGLSDRSFCSSLNLFVLDQIGYLPETTAVYRELKESVSHSTDDKKLLKYKKGVFNTKCAFVEKYSNLFNEKEIEGLYSAFYLEIYRLAIICGDKELIQIIKAYKPLRNNWGLQLRIYMPWIVKLKNKLVKK